MNFEKSNAADLRSNSFPPVEGPDQFEAWADRNNHWLEQTRPRRRRAKRERNKEPLVLCGHGVSLNVDRGALLIRDGLTHHPQARVTYRFFKGDLDLPPRIVMLDGSGSLSFDVLAWLSDQSVPLMRIDWKGEVVSVIGGSGFAQMPERVKWQIETRNDPTRRLEFCCELIAEKLRSSLKTLEEIVPDSSACALAVTRCHAGISMLASGNARSVEDVRAIEANAAAAYFNAWKGLPLIWRSRWKHPIPDAWQTIGARRSNGRGRFATNRNATHPVSAMLNYAYASLRSQIHMEAASEGYDPRRGIMHHDRDDTQAFVYDLIEPRRPIADAAVLSFVLKTAFTGADFVIRGDGVCRLAPQLARKVASLGLTA